MGTDGRDVSKYLDRDDGVKKVDPDFSPASAPVLVSPSSIQENREAQSELVDGASEYLGGEREGIHVSHLTQLRQAYYRKTHPEVLPTEDEVGYYLAGRGHHGVIQYISTLPEYQEYEVNYAGVVGHIDMLHDVPVELKTSRDYEVKAPEDLPVERSHYFKQLGFYCAMTDSPRGRLLLFYLKARPSEGGKTKPIIKAYDVKYGNLRSIKREMLRRKDKLEEALEQSDPELVPPCPDWMCSNCRYDHLCPEGDSSE